MRMKKILALILAGSMVFSVGCQKKNSDSNNSDNNSSDGPKKISEVRENIQSDYSELMNGGYANLKSDKIDVVFTEENELHNLHIERRSDLFSNDEFADMIKSQVAEVKKVFGKDVRDKNILISYGEESVAYSKKYLENVKKGTYDDKRYALMLYDSDNLKKPPKYHEYMHLSYNNGLVMIISENAGRYGFDEDEKLEEKIYRVNNKENNLDDKYKMCDGSEMSVNDMIEEAKAYGSAHFVNDYSMNSVVEAVTVVGNKKSGYSYTVCFVREYDGVLFDRDGNLSQQDLLDESQTIAYDTYEIRGYGKDKIGFYVMYVGNNTVTETNTVDSIISLGEALHNLSDSVGDNATYTIKNIKLAYRNVEKNEEQGIYDAHIVWEIETINDVDNKESRFYVDAVKGDVEVDVFGD